MGGDEFMGKIVIESYYGKNAKCRSYARGRTLEKEPKRQMTWKDCGWMSPLCHHDFVSDRKHSNPSRREK